MIVMSLVYLMCIVYCACIFKANRQNTHIYTLQLVSISVYCLLNLYRSISVLSMSIVYCTCNLCIVYENGTGMYAVLHGSHGTCMYKIDQTCTNMCTKIMKDPGESPSKTYMYNTL